MVYACATLASQHMTQSSGVYRTEKKVGVARELVLRGKQRNNRRLFRADVVQLMREYAQFDPARTYYRERASRMVAGAQPEEAGQGMWTGPGARGQPQGGGRRR